MEFLLIGLIVGTIGTLIGAGGGFLLVPILIYKFPTLPATEIAAVSMLAVGANATSGSIAYAFKSQIHWKSAFIFSIAAIPGIFLGIYLNDQVDRHFFIMMFGVIIILLSVYVFSKSLDDKILVQKRHSFSFDKRKAYIGSAISVFIGILSSFLGIGGGIIHVPLLGTVLDYPIHLAAGTSHFILALTSLIAVSEHWTRGNYHSHQSFLIYLIIGIVAGAQAGANLSKYVSSSKILTILSIALFLGGIRLCLY
jgi:uncharacterized membrane protein YfcA